MCFSFKNLQAQDTLIKFFYAVFRAFSTVLTITTGRLVLKKNFFLRTWASTPNMGLINNIVCLSPVGYGV